MTQQEAINIYRAAYKEARDFRTEYTAHTMKPFVGPREALSFLKGYFRPSPSVGYADPVPFGTRLRAFFSKNPAAVINRTPMPAGRKRTQAI